MSSWTNYGLSALTNVTQSVQALSSYAQGVLHEAREEVCASNASIKPMEFRSPASPPIARADYPPRSNQSCWVAPRSLLPLPHPRTTPPSLTRQPPPSRRLRASHPAPISYPLPAIQPPPALPMPTLPVLFLLQLTITKRQMKRPRKFCSCRRASARTHTHTPLTAFLPFALHVRLIFLRITDVRSGA